MKKICFIISMVIGVAILVSCKPVYILYSVEYMQPFAIEDSIDIKMTDTTTLFSHGRSIISFAFEMTNKKKNSIIFGNNSILVLENGSNAWHFKRESSVYIPKADSIICIKSDETKSLETGFYNVRDSMSASVLIDYKLTKKVKHRLILYLDMEDMYQNKIGKNIVLKPIGIRKF